MQVFVLTCSLRQTIDFYSMQAKPIEALHSIQTKIEQTIDWTEIIHLLYVHQTKILLWLQVQKAGLQISKILIFSRKCCLYVFFLLISKSTWCSVGKEVKILSGRLVECRKPFISGLLSNKRRELWNYKGPRGPWLPWLMSARATTVSAAQ